ncbi:Extracellular Matrix protein PelB [hydrothermal vent metagenome]|uniref:Extracellular Matrix protein PelB n=1 Tax=hydrothermal vent metagenome TaxID=652676 RepID=A0A1W1ECU5_9ZZZZ
MKFFPIFLMLFVPMLICAEELNSVEEQNITKSEDVNLSKNELQLMYQIFVYKSELELAYDVAKKALKKEPNNIEWHRKLAEVSLWLDHTQEAMKHYLIVYNDSPTEKLRNFLIKTGISFYQYDEIRSLVKTEMLLYPTEENIKKFSYIWQEAGYPDEGADILFDLYKEDNNQTYALEQAFSIYEQSGNREKIDEILAYTKMKNIDSSVVIEKSANFYYSSHDIEKSYQTLMKLWSQEKYNPEYLRQISDLGWYIGDLKNAVKASIALDELKEAKRQDYERMMAMAKEYPNKAKYAALYGWRHYQKTYFFYTYAYLSLEQENQKTLIELFYELENSEEFSLFNQDPFYYLIKAQAYQIDGNVQKATLALNMALKLKPNDPEILSSLIWLYMDTLEDKELKKLIETIEKRPVSYALYIPLASAYFYLKEPNKSKKYLFEVLKREPNNVDIKVLYAYILQIENEPQAFMKQMMEVYNILEKQKNRNIKLLKDKNFIGQYLRVAMFVINPDSFVALLKSSKPYMSADSYANIALLWSLRNNAEEQTRILIRSMSRVEPWVQINQALHYKNNYNLQALIYKYTVGLPLRDRVEAARQSGNLSLGYTLAFDGVERSTRDELLYKQFKEYAQERADIVSSEIGTLNRDTLQQHYVSLKNRNYLAKGYWLYSNLLFNSNHLKGNDTLSTVPKDETILSLSVKREFDKGYLIFGGGYRKAMKDYAFYNGEFNWQLANRINMSIEGGYRNIADETVYLLLGGMKNYARLSLSYTLLPSIEINLEYENVHYYSQDNIYLGNGNVGTIYIQKRFREGYPDISVLAYVNFGRFGDEKEKYGIIEKLLVNDDTDVVPTNYDNIGLTFNYGIQNRDIFTRVWRPYASFSPFYDTKNENASYSLSGGIGGELYHQDHTKLGFEYVRSVNGTKEKSLKVYFEYKLLY